LETAFFAGFRLAVVFLFSVRFLATVFLAAFFTVLGFLVLAFERLDVVFLVAIKSPQIVSVAHQNRRQIHQMNRQHKTK
jgi:hypothetical protein